MNSHSAPGLCRVDGVLGDFVKRDDALVLYVLSVCTISWWIDQVAHCIAKRISEHKAGAGVVAFCEDGTSIEGAR